jgi:hypothetical protein
MKCVVTLKDATGRVLAGREGPESERMDMIDAVTKEVTDEVRRRALAGAQDDFKPPLSIEWGP